MYYTVVGIAITAPLTWLAMLIVGQKLAVGSSTSYVTVWK